jgi:hypothetical protein
LTGVSRQSERPTITKRFGAATVALNGSTTLTFIITNPNATLSLTGIGFTDTLPTGRVVATPNGRSCGGSPITATAGSGPSVPPSVSRRSMLSGIGSWRRHENNVRLDASGPREERRGPVSGRPKHRMKWITLELGFAGLNGRCFGVTLRLSPLDPKWALVNTTVWWKTDSVGRSTSVWRDPGATGLDRLY